MITGRTYDKFTFGIFWNGGFCLDVAFGWIGFSWFFNVAKESALEALPEMPPIQCQDCGSKNCLSQPFKGNTNV